MHRDATPVRTIERLLTNPSEREECAAPSAVSDVYTAVQHLHNFGAAKVQESARV